MARRRLATEEALHKVFLDPDSDVEPWTDDDDSDWQSDSDVEQEEVQDNAQGAAMSIDLPPASPAAAVVDAPLGHADDDAPESGEEQ